MKILVTGSRPYTDGFEIQSTLLSYYEEMKGEIIEVHRNETGSAESIAGFLCRQHADLGLVDMPAPGFYDLASFRALHVFLQEGADRRRADRMIAWAKAAGILVEITTTE
ncbi:hypothetical protein [Frigoribacterium sp. UYMn621]|uniref:hypothetical protein n=1 Tax=Frigoribacterium sp. UYMn621 TaxID=3156343 RepID=UPI0033994615